jgi:flagellar biosynthesis protein FlhF
MRLKAFHAETASAAMALIREELGEDAIIVATQNEDDGVRITAAIDEDAAAGPAVLGAELEEGDRADPVDVVYDAFKSHGVPAAVGEPLLEEIGSFETRDPRTALAAALRSKFRFAPLGPGGWAKPLMPVGVPGAGKTQSTAKLAARELMAGRAVALLSTDIERTGGAGQLQAFAAALRVDVLTAADPATLADGLLAVRDRPSVIIDSSGRNPRDAEDMAEQANFLLDGRIEPLLVLPAGLDPVEAGEMASAFYEMGARRMLVTRLDLTRRLGGVLAAGYASDLAFAEASATPMIKDGLSPLDPICLARLLLPNRRADERRRRTGT